MQYISLSNSAVTHFVAKGCLSELSGSSAYQVFDQELVPKYISKPKGIERTTATRDICQQILNGKITLSAEQRIKENYNYMLNVCKSHKFTSERELSRLDQLQTMLRTIERRGERGQAMHILLSEDILQSQCVHKFRTVRKSKLYKLNKTKVKAKIWALFNVLPSRKFMAFYSVSFPANNSANSIFVCWNNWLTYLRKNFGFNNYIWVSELQKNKTIHYHMFTNFRLPILQVNRAMAIIINNQVKAGLMQWGNSSLERYNGVDVDSVYNSKRHKNTGKNMNPTELRNWLSKYITKYVSKNNETFTNLAWHCSRSVSRLFTSTVYPISERRIVEDHLPVTYFNYFATQDYNDVNYIRYVTDFCTIFVFMFVPPPILFEKIIAYNNDIFGKYVIKHKKHDNLINYKTKII